MQSFIKVAGYRSGETKYINTSHIQQITSIKNNKTVKGKIVFYEDGSMLNLLNSIGVDVKEKPKQILELIRKESRKNI